MSLNYLQTENRLGVVRIHVTHLFEEYTRQVFNSLLIVRAETLLHIGHVVEYIGYHPDFSAIPEGMEAPLYQCFLDASGKLQIVLSKVPQGFPSDWVRLGNKKC